MQWNQKLWRRSLDQLAEFLEPLVAELGRGNGGRKVRRVAVQ
jgi:hypothetical protein